MKIGIDSNALGRPFQHGTKRYAEELINALAKIDKKNTYLLYTYNKIQIPKQKNFKLVLLPRFPILKRQLFLPLMVKKDKLDVFHNIDPFGSVFLKHPHLITSILDLDLKTVYPTFRNIKYFIKRYYAEIARHFIIRNSKYLLAISNATLVNLRKYLSIRRLNIPTSYAHLGVSTFFYKPVTTKPKEKYFLCMGDFSPRKNLNTVFKAYSLFDNKFKENYRLKVVVSTDEEARRIKLMSIDNAIHKWTEIIIAPSEIKLRSLYQSAICFLYPSLYEGFGLPILESMASRCPVITSNSGVLKEVAGTNALLVNPLSHVQIKNAMNKLITNSTLRGQLIHAGYKRSKQFSWEETARKTLKAYEAVSATPIIKNKWVASSGFYAVFILVLGLLFFLFQYKNFTWSTFVVSGNIPKKLYIKGKTLIFGTNYSKLYFLDINNDKNVKTVDLNSGNASPQKIVGNDILVISDDSLRLIDITSQNVIWKVATGNEYFFETADVYKNYVVAGSADGILRAFNIKNGKLIWKFDTKPVKKLSSISAGGYLYYFGSVFINQGEIYLASQDRTLYRLKITDGSLVWKSEINDSINADIKIYRDFVYLTTWSGNSIALDKNTGNVIWKNNENTSIICSNLVTSFTESDIAQVQIISSLKQFIAKFFSKEQIALYELRGDNSLVRRDGRTGNVIWKTEKFKSEVYCPSIWRSNIILASSHGDLVVLSMASGKTIFKKTNLGKITNSIVVLPRFGKIIPRVFDIFPPRIIVSNSDGVLRAINGNTGRALWEFNANAPTYLGLLVDKGYIYFATRDGLIYKLSKNTGVPVVNKSDKKFGVSISSEQYIGSEIFEFNLNSKSTFVNPWREARLDAVFTNQEGKRVYVPGFYYDQNLWKVRFNPPTKGKWKWTLIWQPHGAKLSKNGEITSNNDTSKFYLRIDKVNPTRLTVDGKTIFNGIGLGDTVNDQNYNGSPLDDWAIGGRESSNASVSAGIIGKYKSDAVNSLDDYISVYGPKGAGFNMFRWSLMNASQSLYTNLGYPTTYSTLQTKIGDRLVTSLRKNDMHIWLTLFGFDIPFKGSNDPVDLYVLKSYVRYVFARYGAYVDVWEVANELGVPKNTAEFIKIEISNLDYEHRPISISSDLYNVFDGSVIAPHWYESEDLNKSDFSTVKKIDDFKSKEKPIIFAEQGNLIENYDPTSAVRMRVRSWTSFFYNAILMFWNQSDSKEFKGGLFPGNIYLGPEEQGYVKILQNFTKNIPLDSKPAQFQINNYGVRGYGLTSSTITGVYFYHFESPFSDISFGLNITTKAGGKVDWIDPATGKTLQTGSCPPGNCILASPMFKTDSVLFIRSSENIKQ